MTIRKIEAYVVLKNATPDKVWGHLDLSERQDCTVLLDTEAMTLNVAEPLSLECNRAGTALINAYDRATDALIFSADAKPMAPGETYLLQARA